jgi:hypothetical protein
MINGETSLVYFALRSVEWADTLVAMPIFLKDQKEHLYKCVHVQLYENIHYLPSSGNSSRYVKLFCRKIIAYIKQAIGKNERQNTACFVRIMRLNTISSCSPKWSVHMYIFTPWLLLRDSYIHNFKTLWSWLNYLHSKILKIKRS